MDAHFASLNTRISTDEENQPTSLHSQKDRLKALSALHAKLDGLKDQDQQLAAEAPHASDTAALHATANALEDAICAGRIATPTFARRTVQWAILGSNQ